eukprot:TRINITY_DN19434_c0_g1_i4.p1 TRINITY_DN19434_c0_g1~~TRINITY_DN19434_c0_g1_i4.p1  ORF type:complete len:227 (+),score=50.02 TRINITY_DN19434_c0_g1_i4:71-751(+)
MEEKVRALQTPEHVLEFWFGAYDRAQMNTVPYIQERMGLWFGGKCKAFDETQRQSAALVEEVGALEVSGSGGEWGTPKGMLARVILLDQFTRCMYRGTAEAFQYDAVTAATVKQLFDDRSLVSDHYLPIERFFLGVAIQHAEDLAMQRIGVQIAAVLVPHGETASNDIRDFFSSLKGYPHEHFEVIERFGRFPSRNDALGRSSTDEETAWLESPECPAWAKSQRKS